MAAIRRDQPTTVPWLYLCCVLLLSNLLVYQWASTNSSLDDSYHAYALLSSTTKHVDSGADPYGSSASDGVSSTPAEVLRNPLVVPRGEAVPLPSIRTAKDESVTTQRSIYGGAGDKKHLGGFTDIDTGGISPRAWKWMVQRMNIHSVLDVGCGRGISTTWFHFHGLQVLCVEGSHDARERTLLPDPDTQMVEHDFARGPWWPGRTFDAVWCVEFLEHVSSRFRVLKKGQIYQVHDLMETRVCISHRLVETSTKTTFQPSGKQVSFLSLILSMAVGTTSKFIVKTGGSLKWNFMAFDT